MSLPAFFDATPALDLPFPDDVVTSHAVRSDVGLVAFFGFHKNMDLPSHSHGPQSYTVIAGEIVYRRAGCQEVPGSADFPGIVGGVDICMEMIPSHSGAKETRLA